jgi:response regulator RpfG family c-di-GMP phosphodiesterase
METAKMEHDVPEPLQNEETQFTLALQELRVGHDDTKAIRAFLALLKYKSPITYLHYLHSLRVALLGRLISRFLGQDEKAQFYAGSLHDVGKAEMPLEVLGKTKGWTENDSRIMEDHVLRSYSLIRGRFDFTAEVILWHHKFQRRPYPLELPQNLHGYSTDTQKIIIEHGRVLALSDSYDAMHRKNEREGRTSLKETEIKERLMEWNPDRKQLILNLYDSEIMPFALSVWQ